MDRTKSSAPQTSRPLEGQPSTRAVEAPEKKTSAKAPPPKPDESLTAHARRALPAKGSDEQLALLAGTSKAGVPLQPANGGQDLQQKAARNWEQRLVRSRYAKEQFATSNSRSTQDVLNYCILRKAGLDARTAAAQCKSTARASYLHIQEAKEHPHVKHEQERIDTYCAWRALGADKNTALENCKFGPFYLQASLNGQSSKIAKLLAEYGLEHGPLVYPRMAIDIPKDAISVIGTGAINTVYKVQVNGKTCAFKPATPQSKKDENAISPAGQLAGITLDEHFPEARHIATVKLAQALDLSGERRVIGDAFIAIVNGVPGLMMDYVPGSADAPQMEFNRALPKGHKLYKYKTQLNDPGKAKALAKKFGYHSIKLVDGQLMVTANKSNADSSEKYGSLLYRRTMLDMQLLAHLANAADAHGKNMMSYQPGQAEILPTSEDGEASPTQGNGAPEWRPVLIDCDDCFGEKNKSDSTVDRFEIGGMAAFFGVPRPRALMKRTANRLQGKAFQDQVQSLRADLKASGIPDGQLAALDARIKLVTDNLHQVEIIASSERLKAKKFGNPRLWMMTRNLGQETTAAIEKSRQKGKNAH